MNKSNHNLGKDATILAVAKMVPLGVSMIMAILLSRCLSLHDYGTYSQIMLLVNLAVAFLALGLPNSINYFVAKEKDFEKQSEYVSNYYVLLIILGGLGGIALFLVFRILPNILKIVHFINLVLLSLLYLYYD